MTHSWERGSIQKMTAQFEGAGYRVREGEPFGVYPHHTEIMLDIEGHGELFEAYFRRDPGTGYWRWYRGFRHVGVSGDRYPVLYKFRELVLMCSRDPLANPDEGGIAAEGGSQ